MPAVIKENGKQHGVQKGVKTTGFHESALEAFLGQAGANSLLSAALCSAYLQQNTLQAFVKGQANGQKTAVEKTSSVSTPC